MLDDQLIREAIYSDFLSPWYELLAILTKQFIAWLVFVFGG